MSNELSFYMTNQCGFPGRDFAVIKAYAVDLTTYIDYVLSLQNDSTKYQKCHGCRRHVTYS